jgi:rhamnulokinase
VARRAHLALDLGAESGRAILGVLDGATVSLRELHRFPNRPLRLPGGLHWNVPGLWTEVLEGLRRAARVAAGEGLHLVSVGVDTWGVDFGLLSGSGELLGLPRAYRDERSAEGCLEALRVVGERELYELTGIQHLPFNTLFQLVAGCRADPELVSAARRLLFMPDLFHHYLCGQMANEETIASTSQMLGASTGTWCEALLRRLRIPARILGPLVRPGTALGPLREGVAAEAGAAREVLVVAPASHDTASAVAAVPAEDGSRWCYLSSGTWSLLGAELEAPVICGPHVHPPFTNERGVAGTVRFLRNISGMWLIEECRRALARDGIDADYETLLARASRAEPFRTLIDPGWEPLLAPGDMPARIAEFARRTGQPRPTDPGALVRCCLESLALCYRRTLYRLEEVLGRRYDVVHVIGGGGRNRVLAQMTADATGRRVLVGPFEATALGNVLVQALGTGALSDREELRRLVRRSMPPEEFTPRDTPGFEAQERRFVELSCAAAPGGAAPQEASRT